MIRNYLRRIREELKETGEYYHPAEPLVYKASRGILRRLEFVLIPLAFGAGMLVNNMIKNESPVEDLFHAKIFVEGLLLGHTSGFNSGVEATIEYMIQERYFKEMPFEVKELDKDFSEI